MTTERVNCQGANDCNWEGIVQVDALQGVEPDGTPIYGGGWKACREHAAPYRKMAGFRVIDSLAGNRLLPRPEPEHVCNWKSAWPTGHPLPPEDPDRLEGPEVGTFMLYTPSPIQRHIRNAETGETVIQTIVRPAIVVRVIRRSYVWSPGECRSHGGYRHYDWSVIEEGPGEYRSVVVNDDSLSPIPEVSHWGNPPAPMKVHTVYTLQQNVPALGPEEGDNA